MTFHCFFEQSGTFKNEFKKLGYNAIDYDILDDYGETDHRMDLFAAIEYAFQGGVSIFDEMKEDDQIIAFFPCIRFSNQAYMMFQGKQSQLKNKSLEEKMLADIKFHNELNELYCLISKLVIVCCRRNIPLIIENPYSLEHYLTRYWACRASLIDDDRRKMGDYFKKPTQYFFINREPSNNFIFEAVNIKNKKRIHLTNNQKERSMISKDYANRFIREFILPSCENGCDVQQLLSKEEQNE